MAIVQPKSQRWRLLAAHLFLLALCAAVVFPFLVVLSVSLRPGNFASGSLIPSTISLEHWRYVLGMPYIGVDGKQTMPDLPVMAWLWNSIKVAAMSACVTLLLSTTASFAQCDHKSVIPWFSTIPQHAGTTTRRGRRVDPVGRFATGNSSPAPRSSNFLLTRFENPVCAPRPSAHAEPVP